MKEGKNGHPFTEEDLHNSEISRQLRDDFCAPWEPLEPTPSLQQQPWWNPEDTVGTNFRRGYRYNANRQETPYPQLSTLTKLQHLMGLRVLSSEYGVQPCNYPSPTQDDIGSFGKVKELYEKEQREFRLWARMRWINRDFSRALNPQPLLEAVYKAQFELAKKEIHTLPHNFTMATKISLETRTDTFELQLKKDLKKVDLKSVPIIELKQNVSVLLPYVVPKPCYQHSSRFVLPREKKVTVLPLPEIHRELAQYAMENGAIFIASENSLQCLLETDRNWMISISVVEVFCPESGGVKTVVVFGQELRTIKQCGAMRTQRAYRQLLGERMLKKTETQLPDTTEAINNIIGVNPSSSEDMDDINCTCKGTPSEFPPARSFRKWKVQNTARSTRNQSFDIIIHSSHKAREGENEVILEPIVEWQPDLGACKQSDGRLRALALSLMIRPKAELINVHVDYGSGRIIKIEKVYAEKFMVHGQKRSEIAGRIHRAIEQLRFLKPGCYILTHDNIHGAMLYSMLSTTRNRKNTLSLRPEINYLSVSEEEACAKKPPELCQAILPYVRSLEILPLAFTWDKKRVKENKEVTAASARARLPPPAIQWKKKMKKKKKNQWRRNTK